MEQHHHQQALQEVQAEIAGIEEKIGRLTAQLEELRVVARWHAGKLETRDSESWTPVQEAPIPPGSVQEADWTPLPTHPHGEPLPRFSMGYTMKEAAMVVLSEANGTMMTTPAIAAKILKGGYPTKNADGFRNAVYSMLNKANDQFYSPAPGFWMLQKHAPVGANRGESETSNGRPPNVERTTA